MKSKYIEYYLWYALLPMVIGVIVTVWVLSFQVPIDTSSLTPIQWIIQNSLTLFIAYLFFCTAVLALFLAIVFYSPYTINLKEPFTFQGIFLLGITVLLLSSFFVTPSTPLTNPVRFYDTHPLIFYTAVGFVILALLAALSTNIKIHVFEHKEL
jgi:hypothetical protein